MKHYLKYLSLHDYDTKREILNLSIRKSLNFQKIVGNILFKERNILFKDRVIKG